MASSCSRDKEARWGAYSKMKELTSKGELNKHTRNKIIRAYQNEYGLVTYNSESKVKIDNKKPIGLSSLPSARESHVYTYARESTRFIEI